MYNTISFKTFGKQTRFNWNGKVELFHYKTYKKGGYKRMQQLACNRTFTDNK